MSSRVPPYLDHIDLLASRHDSAPESYETKLLASWASFERDCKRLTPEYDILRDRLGPEFLNSVSEFIRLLYRNGESSPKADCDQIREKDAAYGGSWHSRGGTGAFHALARKGDRLVSMLGKHGSLVECRKDKTNSESIDDTIGDLRRYLILVLAWHEARNAVVLSVDRTCVEGCTFSRSIDQPYPRACIRCGAMEVRPLP